MIEWLFLLVLVVCCAIGFGLILQGFLGYKSIGYSVLAMGLIELGLLVQTATATGMVIAGQLASISTLEFFGYLIVALLVPLGGTLFALAEKSRWSLVILGFSALTVAVMQLRMWQIWTGSPYFS